MELRDGRICTEMSVVVIVGVVQSVGMLVVFPLVRLLWFDSVVVNVSVFGVLCSAVNGVGLFRCVMFGGVRCSVVSGAVFNKV